MRCLLNFSDWLHECITTNNSDICTRIPKVKDTYIQAADKHLQSLEGEGNRDKEPLKRLYNIPLILTPPHHINVLLPGNFLALRNRSSYMQLLVIIGPRKIQCWFKRVIYVSKHQQGKVKKRFTIYKSSIQARH